MRFCGRCGERLDAAVSGGDPVARDERRQLTVLFCDLVGSTALAERLDPEDLQQLVRLYQEWAVEILERHEGRVAQYLGDGILVYFGYPHARENSATNAVSAGLELIEHLDELRARLHRQLSTGASIRVGIHTGLVVVGLMGKAGRSEHLALGETPNVAARLQALTDPDTVLISEATHRLTRHRFAFEALGPQSLHGLTRPVEVYRVLREETGSRVFHNPMVGRGKEIDRLEYLLTRVREGRDAQALILGEAGLGKSRLVADLQERTTALDAEGVTWVEMSCSVQYRTSVLYPLVGAMARTFGIRRKDDADAKLRKIDRSLQEVAPELVSARPFFALHFGVSPDDPKVLDLSPALRRSRTLEALVEWVLALARKRPLVLVVEDIHWSDPSTREWLEQLLLRAPHPGLFVLMTSRRESALTSSSLAAAEILTLTPLEHQHVLELIEGVRGSRDLSPDLVSQLVDKTDGVPLFVEEMTRSLVEADLDDGPVDSRSIPSTLQDSLMARLDRLGPDKNLVQWAAVFGREVRHEWLATAVDDMAEISGSLERAAAAGILQVRGRPPRAIYEFRHALLQDAAYGSLLRRERRRRHVQVADVLEDTFPEEVTKRPEVLAHHATEGDDFERAARAWLAAGERAMAHSALQECEIHLHRGLVVLAELPDDGDRAGLELRLRRLLGSALLAVRGYADDQVQTNYARARDLGRELGPSRELFDALRGLHPFFLVRAQHVEARELADQLLELARQLEGDGLEIEARLTLATSSYWTGQVAESLRHAERLLDLYDGDRHAVHASLYGQDPAVLGLVYAGWCHAWLGRPRTAMEVSREAVHRARALEHPHTLTMALDHFCVLHQHLNERRGVGELLEESARLSHQYGFAMWAAMAGFRQGWLDVHTGRVAQGIERLQAGLEAFETTGAAIAQPLHWAYLAEACCRDGRIGQGLRAVERARTALELHREHHWAPELPRLEGELTWLRDGPTDEVGEHFRHALKEARELGCRLLELRAAVSRARWLQERGEHDAARAVLYPVYTAMEKGTATPDMATAEELLTDLSTAISGRSR